MRLPGSGGAAEIAIHAKRTLVISRLEKQAFPADVDFITSPGHSCPWEASGDLRTAGRAVPCAVVTDREFCVPNVETGGS